MNDPSIYSWIKSEEARYQTDEIQVGDNWNWNMRSHIQLLFHLRYGVFYTGSNEWNAFRAFKNIMEPIFYLSKWTEDIELKDVVFYIEEENGRILSFLVKKYHDEIYVKRNDLDTLFDELIASDLTFGGMLSQKTNAGRPEVLQFNSIAFCDQTDLMGSPMGFRLNFGPDKLRSMTKFGWGDKKNGATISIPDLIVLADNQKAPDGTQQTGANKVPGRNIEVYIVKGTLPEHYLKGNDNFDDWYGQVHIVAFYTDKDNRKQGVTLYRKEDDGESLKFSSTEPIHGRALGRSLIESLLHPQVWTNVFETYKLALLKAASKVPLYTDDPTYTQKNKIDNMENLEITTVQDGKRILQVPTATPANIQLFSQGINEWYEQAQLAGSAFDPIMGKEAASGTTFRGQERSVAQNQGLHTFRRGQRAKFIEEIYRDWIIPDIKKEILQGKKFLASLTTEELDWVSQQLAENYANTTRNEAVLNGEIPPEKDQLKQQFLQDFRTKGNKHMLEILAKEFDDVEIKLGINVANKQKDLAGVSDKLLSIFQFIIANPQGFQYVMQLPGMSKAFNDILEYSGLNQVDFAALSSLPPPQMQAPGAQQPTQPGQPAPQLLPEQPPVAA